MDAIGRTIDELGRQLSDLPEKDRPAQVIVTILTDGLENASQRYTWKDVSERIKHQSDFYKWTFLFLGANQDAIATAAQISIAASNASGYAADPIGTHSSHRSTARKVRALRKMSMGTANAEDHRDAAAPMSDIVKEEDQKERGK